VKKKQNQAGRLSGPTSGTRKVLDNLFEAAPLLHPHVKEAFQQAAAVLKVHRIPFRVIGGLVLNQYGAGRPTKDVEMVVSKKNWHRAREALQSIATDRQGIRFGLPDEPEAGIALLGPNGVAIEVWPEGVTHGQIAALRGKQRPHPAGRLALSLRGENRTALLNNKLASYLSARDRLRDAADAQALISKWKLPLNFSDKLHPAVRVAYRRIWRGL
jgi:hypothetical protein